MTLRLGSVDLRTGGRRPPVGRAYPVPWRAGGGRALGSLAALAGALLLLSSPVPASAATPDTCPNAQYRTGLSAALPDCRAYELVTPADKDAGSLTITLGHGGWMNLNAPFPASSGDRFFTYSSSLMADPRGMSNSELISVRSKTGWETTNLQPGACRSTVISGLLEGWRLQALSEDLSTGMYQVAATKSGEELGCDPRDQAGTDVYRADLDGSVAWVSQDGQAKTDAVDSSTVNNGLSADGTRILFTTPQKFFPEDVDRVGSGFFGGHGLYVRTGSQTVPVGVKTDGSLINPCGAEGAINGMLIADQTASWSISRDNRVIFFASARDEATAGCGVADGGGQLYARIDGLTTVLVSGSQRTSPDPATIPVFRGATPDGRRAYFTSTARLTDQATVGGGLYEYDLTAVLNGSAATGTLRFLSPSTDGNPANVTRLLRVVGDGQQVYFVAGGILAGGAMPNSGKIYRAADGQVQLVAQASSTLDWHTSSISVDGSKLVYLDRPSGQSYQQVYLVDTAHPGTPTCVSCSLAGTPDTGPGTLVNITGSGGLQSFDTNPFVTNDGRVFFGSPQRLATGDSDDNYDVYEYRAGNHHLLTPGTTTTDAFLVGMGPDGRDVFFAAGDSLVAKDFDNGDQDIYTARVGGGFAQPPEPSMPCAGDGCQLPELAPVLATPGSVGFVAPFVTPQKTPVPRRLSVKRPKTVSGTTKVRLSVKVPEAGRIRVSGSGLTRANKSVKRAKTYRVTVKLSRRSVRTLKRKHRVKVRATVRFTPKHGKGSRTRIHLTFQEKQGRQGKQRSYDSAQSSTEKGGR